MRLNLSTTCAVALAIGAFTVSSGSFDDASAARAQDGDDEPVRDGMWLYTRNCAGCHNDNGDGKGPTILQLGLTARDFAQGGFAFGDTPEQLFKTITTGIPGRSPMPSFKGVLTEEEIELVIGHVRTLMPERKDEAPKNTEMIVKDRPVIARGKLPPIAEGAKEVPRGLLIGTPEGMTFEYDLADMRLMGVRLGRFADREDWGGRGGGYLKPLGTLVYSLPVLPAGSRFEFNDSHNGGYESRRVLRSTRVRSNETTLSYVCLQPDVQWWECVEQVKPLTLSVGAGYSRTFQITGNCYHVRLLLGGQYSSPWQLTPRGELPGLFWATCDLGEQGIEAVLIDGNVEADSDEPSALVGVIVAPFMGNTPGPCPDGWLSSCTVRVPKWTPEVAAQLEKELSK